MARRTLVSKSPLPIFGGEPDLLEFDRPLVAAGLLVTTGLLVLVLTVVEQTRDRRSGHGSHLDEVDAPLLRKPESLDRWP